MVEPASKALRQGGRRWVLSHGSDLEQGLVLGLCFAECLVLPRSSPSFVHTAQDPNFGSGFSQVSPPPPALGYQLPFEGKWVTLLFPRNGRRDPTACHGGGPARPILIRLVPPRGKSVDHRKPIVDGWRSLSAIERVSTTLAEAYLPCRTPVVREIPAQTAA